MRVSSKLATIVSKATRRKSGAMQILLPYPNKALSASILTTEDLHEQTHDIAVALRALHQTDEETAEKFYNDPYVQMWLGHEVQLAEFGLVCIEELVKRGKQCALAKEMSDHFDAASSGELGYPVWWAQTNIHLSHKQALVTRNGWYSRYFPFVRPGNANSVVFP